MRGKILGKEPLQSELSKKQLCSFFYTHTHTHRKVFASLFSMK